MLFDPKVVGHALLFGDKRMGSILGVYRKVAIAYFGECPIRIVVAERCQRGQRLHLANRVNPILGQWGVLALPLFHLKGHSEIPKEKHPKGNHKRPV